MRRLHLRSGLVVGMLVGALAGCGDGAKSSASLPAPPAVDFLMSAGDSTFWVTGTRGGLRTRGAPIVVATWGGRFYEIYVTDDDRSFEDAVFVGQHLYRRDLETNDSLMVFADTAAPRAAARYAEANPSARPLSPDEEGAEDPPVATTAEIDVLDVYGPYLSFEYHVDVRDGGSEPWHSTRRGVVDLRDGKPVSLRALFGVAESKRLADAGRATYLATLDSVRAAAGVGERARRAARALPDFRFDPASFSISDREGRPTVEFAAPGAGEGGGGFTLPLVPMDAGVGDGALAGPLWDSVRTTLPSVAANGSDLVWRRGAYRVLARGDTLHDRTASEETAIVAVATEAHEWPVGRMSGPVRSIFWLDDPPVEPNRRQALQRAFEEAALYDERTRSTAAAPRSTAPVIRFASRPSRALSTVRRSQTSSRRVDVRPHYSR